MMRLNKFLALSGVASRRKADELISDGKIKINGKIIKELGVQIDENNDTIEYDRKIIKIEEEKIYIALNKPVGYISSAVSWQGKSVLELLKSKEIDQRVYPVGRLDKDSRGLIILTNDGDLAYKLTQARFEYEKEYEVEISSNFNTADRAVLEKSMIIDGKRVRGVGVKIMSDKVLRIILKEGINRQIRKMLGNLGYGVLDLNRIRINKLKLIDLNLKVGEWKKVIKSDII
ncbi:MAG: pseudouridine synthase [Candidatus Buchananbacteria bacterium]